MKKIKIYNKNIYEILWWWKVTQKERERERGKKKPTCDRKREGSSSSSSSSSSYCLIWFGQRMNEELEEEQCKCIIIYKYIGDWIFYFIVFAFQNTIIVLGCGLFFCTVCGCGWRALCTTENQILKITLHLPSLPTAFTRFRAFSYFFFLT